MNNELNTNPFDKPDLNELVHYGVKGMRWGHRKAAPKISRRENRKMNKAAAAKFYNDKADKLLSESIKKEDSIIIKVDGPGSPYSTLMTGKEFTTYLSRGGAFDVKTSDIFAELRPDGEAPKAIGNYKKQNFRKNPPTK